MPLRLKSRSQCPPNGFYYKQRETGWELTTWSFDALCQQLEAHRRMNPQYRLNTNPNAIAEEVDEANALRVSAIPNAESYLAPIGVSPPKIRLPQSKPPGPNAGLVGAAAKVKGGVSLLTDWLGSGGRPVILERAEQRAAVCAGCPHNDDGDLSRFFTVPVSEAIRRTLELKNHLKFQTEHDDKLKICNVCLCPLKLKVFVPIGFIADHTDPETMAKFPAHCWIKRETEQNPDRLNRTSSNIGS